MIYKLKALKLLLSFCFGCIFLLSCNDKKNEPEKSNYIEAKINGALWSPYTVSCILLTDTTYHFRIVNFTATYSGKIITLEARDNATGNAISTGNRSFTSGEAYFGYANSGIPYHTVSGYINVEAVESSSQLISGSFDFTVEDNDGNQVHISDGRFKKVNYTAKTQ